MGVVFRAWQPSLGRQVALKCMLRSGDPKAEARFAREIFGLPGSELLLQVGKDPITIATTWAAVLAHAGVVAKVIKRAMLWQLVV